MQCGIGLTKLFFEANIREKFNGDYTKEQIAKDVCLIVFCLAGINTADLYDLPTSSLSEKGILCYKRKKTRDKSDSEAYTEIAVPDKIKPLFEKYKGKKRLLIFSERYCNPSDFAAHLRLRIERLF